MKLRGTVDAFLEKFDLPLYGALFLAALLLRLSAIEAAPLSEREAVEAWGALNLLRGQASSSVSALFSSLTAGLLFLAGPSQWAPRILPALAGALCVFLPRLLKDERGRLEAFLAALFLALSPSLWAASTTAGGAALGFLAAAVGIFYLRAPARTPLRSGLILGVAAASGPVGWSGLAIAAAALSADWFLRISQSGAGESQEEFPLRRPFAEFLESRSGPAGFLAGLAAGGTGLFFFPRGLGALAAGAGDWLSAFLSGWPPILETILLFFAYEPAALVFGVAGLFLLWKGLLAAEDRFWGLFAAVAAAWAMLRAAAFPQEALWILLPLAILAARVIRRALESVVLAERPVFLAAQVFAVLALAAFSFLEMAAFHNLAERSPAEAWAHLALALLGLIAGLLAGALFTENWGKDWSQSLPGLALAWAGILLAAQAGAGWNAVHIRRASANEPWRTEAATADLLRLREELELISERQTGVEDELRVVVLGPEESALGWELVGYGAVEYADSLDALAAPAVLIAPYAEYSDGTVAAPRLTAVYRGQSFAAFESRGWYGWPPDFFGWLFYREGPVQQGKWILWVREDILIPEAAG
ncbi:MAG: hypothetical protein JW929_11230 [Anaerolineales bacterium]|nr:hypothetical protein [Anaerolineales bacterium]